MKTKEKHNHKAQTFDQRLVDPNKINLDFGFVAFIRDTARANDKTADEVWQLWQDYSKTCDGYDQSAVTQEFLEWNKLCRE